MMCADPKCNGALRVTHTYTVRQEKFQRAVCIECGSIHRISSTAIPVHARGEGAKAHATRARQATRCENTSSSPF